MDDYRLLTVAQAAERLTVSQAAVYRLIADGSLRMVRPTPGTTRVRSDDLEAYLLKVTEAKPPRVRVVGKAS